jgi:hypothetical protein
MRNYYIKQRLISTLLIFLVLPLFSFGQGKHAVITVTFKNFPVEAQKAFQAAADVWENYIYSDIPIRIEANWTNLAANELGSCVAGGYFKDKDFKGAPIPATIYPVALAEKLSKSELNLATDFEIIATFNSVQANWYYGTDGKAPSGKFDLMTIAIHEIAHGLGFYGSFKVDNLKGSWGDGTIYPSIFDRFVINESANYLVDANVFENNSTDLYTQLVSNVLYFKSNVAKAVNSGIFPKLYAPSTFQSGSSIYHLDENTYLTGNANALMTPKFDNEVIHQPGPIAIAIFQEMGWVNTFIDHTLLKDIEDSSKPSVITAKITGDTTIIDGSYFLNYSFDGFKTNFKKQMQKTTNANEYSAEIPALNTTATISYYISVEDILFKKYTYPAGAPQIFHSFNVGIDNQVPVISHVPILSLIPGDAQVQLEAVITDNLGVNTASVEYLINDAAQASFNLTKGTNNLYTGNFVFSNLKGGDVIKYRIVASDVSSKANKAYNPVSGYYTIKVTTPIETYQNDFNSPTTDFTSEYFIGNVAQPASDNYFKIYTPTGFSNGALNSEHPYKNTGIDGVLSDYVAQLKIPIKLKSTNAQISFDEIALVEPGDVGAVFGKNEFWDYVIVEASKDNGKTWVYLSDGWDANAKTEWLTTYKSNLTKVGRNEISNAVATPALYKNRVISLYGSKNELVAGDIVLIHFRLFSDPFGIGWGWIIDNLKIQMNTVGIENNLDKQDFVLYPNPCNGKCNISFQNPSGNDVVVNIYNLNGQKVSSHLYNQPTGKFALDLNVNQLSKGIYTVQAIFTERIINTKLIIN